MLYRVIRFDERKQNMTIRRVEIERFSVTSSKPFEVVVAALKAAVGHPDMVKFVKATKGARSFADLESAVHRILGKTPLLPSPGEWLLLIDECNEADGQCRLYAGEEAR
jgi:hypothetical protein